jgi:N utilization substance protein A
MLSELDRVLDEIRKDKGIDKEVLISALETALVKAALNKYGHSLDIEAHYNGELGEIELFQFKTVAENVSNIVKEISLTEARKIDPDTELGDEIGVKMDTTQFGRIAAQTAKQVIMQNIREAERENVYSDYKDQKGELVTGYVHRFEKGNIIVLLGKHEALLPSSEQIQGEMFSLRDRIKGYVLDVRKNAKGPQIVISRTHPGFILKLFQLEVPEITEGIVKVHNVVREPGNRAKIAVESQDSRVDPVGACVGNRGSRVQNIVHELHGERIDIIPWTEDHAKFVCSALAPAEVSEIIIDEENRNMEIIVEDSQLSLAIGKKGQNVRLAAKLTSWKIDIRGKSKYEESSKAHLEELMKISGIEESVAEKLCNADYISIESIIRAKVEDLMDALEINKAEAGKIKKNALIALEDKDTVKDKAKGKDKDKAEGKDKDKAEGKDKDKAEGKDKDKAKGKDKDKAEGKDKDNPT